MKKNIIRMKSSSGGEFNTAIEMDRDRYTIQTEAGSKKNPTVTTRVYLRGRIVHARDHNYSDLLGTPDADDRIRAIMDEQHRAAIEMIKAEEKSPQAEEKTRRPTECLDKVRTLIEKHELGEALDVTRTALERTPDNPFLLSYCGYLMAVVEKNYKDGVPLCRKAIQTLDKKIPFGEEFFYPILYLNLGKTYLEAGRKHNAIEAFRKGLSLDNDNREIRKILEKMGIRKRLPFPFLKRSNFLNKYGGILLSRINRKRQT